MILIKYKKKSHAKEASFSNEWVCASFFYRKEEVIRMFDF